MKLSTTVVFSVLFLTVAGFYTYLNPQSGTSSALSPSSAAQLVSLKGGDQIDWIQIQNLERKQTFTFILRGESWMLKYPVLYPADPLIANGLVTALTLSLVNRRLLPEKDWEEYGLLNPSIKVGIQTKRDEKRRYLLLGHQSPVGEYAYAKWEGAKDYFLVDINLKRAFDRSIYSIRQKQIFRTPVGDISRIYVKTFSRELEFTGQNGKWAWVKPQTIAGRPIPKERIDEILIQFRDLFVKDFLDSEKKDRSEYGISDEGMPIKVWGISDAPEIFYLGQEFPSRDGFYGTRAGENIIFLVARDNIRALFELLEVTAEQSSSSTMTASLQTT